MDIHIDLNKPQIINKVTNEQFGLFVAQNWKRLIDKFTPRDVGTLESAVTVTPFQIWYRQNYAHYIYTGLKYVDPAYQTSAFYSPTYGFWSRRDVKKVPTDIPLNYQKKNPYSTDHWDLKAAEAGQLSKLYTTINNALRAGQY